VGSIPITRSNREQPKTTAGPVSDWSIASIREGDLEAEAAALYSAELPYHNFEHILITFESAERIIRHCIDEGVRVDAKIVYYALLFHDAGYHENHIARGFATKEAYSAELARAALLRRQVPTTVIGKVVAAILSTERDASFVSAEQKAVRAADLSGLAADYAVFLDNTERLKQEFDLSRGASSTWAEWLPRVKETVEHYLAQEIRLTSYFCNGDGESEFHRAARDNLARLQQEFGTS
jgi:predicted metal-dependent HD superfamily phosphohydrolase